VLVDEKVLMLMVQKLVMVMVYMSVMMLVQVVELVILLVNFDILMTLESHHYYLMMTSLPLLKQYQMYCITYGLIHKIMFHNKRYHLMMLIMLHFFDPDIQGVSSIHINEQHFE